MSHFTSSVLNLTSSFRPLCKIFIESLKVETKPILAIYLGFLFLLSAVISMNMVLALLLAARPLGLNKYIANNIPGSRQSIINKNII